MLLQGDLLPLCPISPPRSLVPPRPPSPPSLPSAHLTCTTPPFLPSLPSTPSVLVPPPTSRPGACIYNISHHEGWSGAATTCCDSTSGGRRGADCLTGTCSLPRRVERTPPRELAAGGLGTWLPYWPEARPFHPPEPTCLWDLPRPHIHPLIMVGPALQKPLSVPPVGQGTGDNKGQAAGHSQNEGALTSKARLCS